MDAETASDVRLAERGRCANELRRMASVADAESPGITYEGGIDPAETATILRAAAREIDKRWTIEADLSPLAIAAS